MQSTDDDKHIGWAYVSRLRQERIAAGAAALARIDKHQTFYDWHLIGEALTDLRSAAMDQSGSNSPTGKGYNGAWARCVADNPDLVPLSKLNSATRTHCMWLAEHWETVAEWHAELDDATRRLVNHPATVRRRFNQDNPLPPKPRAERDEEPGDEEDELDETEEAYGLGAGGESEDTPEEPEEAEITPEEWVRQFEALWRRLPAAVRGDIADRIILWRSENTARVTHQDAPEADLIGEAEVEINRAAARDAGAKVRALANRKVATSISSEPTPERLAMAVEEALAKPVTEGEDVFAGLGDEVGAGKTVSPERAIARQPKRRRATRTSSQ